MGQQNGVHPRLDAECGVVEYALNELAGHLGHRIGGEHLSNDLKLLFADIVDHREEPGEVVDQVQAAAVDVTEGGWKDGFLVAVLLQLLVVRTIQRGARRALVIVAFLPFWIPQIKGVGELVPSIRLIHDAVALPSKECI